LGIPADIPRNIKSAGKFLEIPADFPENTKSAGNYFLV
jgi:hypothetical protein